MAHITPLLGIARILDARVMLDTMASLELRIHSPLLAIVSQHDGTIGIFHFCHLVHFIEIC